MGTAIGAAVSLAIGGTIAGIQGALTGHGFWQSFGESVSENFVDAVVTSFAFTAVTIAAGNIIKTRCCFKEGTLVETEEGLKPIEEIREGDLVLAYDEATGEQAYKPVVQLFRNTTKEWQYVYIEGETEPIISTPGHKYYLPGNEIHREDGRPEEHVSYAGLSERWVSACSLKKGDRVLLSDGKYGTVERTVCVKLAAPETTYNFEVADFHTYYVSDCKVLVHNSDCNPGSAKKYSTHESRNAAFRAAKRDAGIPMGQQPTKVIQSVDKLGKAIPGRTYIFKSGQNTIKIMEHAAGHVKGGIGPHFNISGYNWHYLYP